MPLFYALYENASAGHAAACAIDMLHVLLLLALHILLLYGLLLHILLLALHVLLLHRRFLHGRGILLCVTQGREDVSALSVGREEGNKFDGEYIADDVIFIADVMQNDVIAADGIQYAKAACHALRSKKELNLHIGAQIILQDILERSLHGDCVEILRWRRIDTGLRRRVVIVHEYLRFDLSIGIGLCGIVKTVIADAYDKLSDV